MKKKRPLAPPPLKSLKRARQITSAFHSATRDLEAALSKGDAGAANEARARVQRLGGREAYQEASAAATGRHKTASRFVWSHLTRLGYRDWRRRKKTKNEKSNEKKDVEDDDGGDDDGDGGDGDRNERKGDDGDGRNERKGDGKPKVLEIGAINTQLLSTPWLDVRSIDLRAPVPAPSLGLGGTRRTIEEIDFFDVERLPRSGGYDVVVCSMVLNCVPCPEKRGEMLRGIRGHLKDGGGGGGDARGEEESGGGGGGLAFIMLPRRCVEASRACDWEHFERRCLARAGLGEIVARRASDKVAFWLARATTPASAEVEGGDDSSEDEALIAEAHAAGEFAVSMRRGGGGSVGGRGGSREGKERKKEAGGKKINGEKSRF